MTSPEPPPTVVIRHKRENPRKCSLEPLRGRPGLHFVRWPLEGPPPPLGGYVRLALEGPPLSAADAERGLLLLDATWRLVAPIERAFAHVPPRSLPPLVTAYPRRSKVFPDPGPGLASIEALYAALRILGRPTEGVLDRFYERERFLALNAGRLP